MSNRIREQHSSTLYPSLKVGILMIFTVTVTLLYYVYLGMPRFFHGCIVCIVCYFTYKGKRWAHICYYIFSVILIFLGAVGVFTVYEKTHGKLSWIEDKDILLSMVRAILQIIALFLLHRWSRKKTG